MFDAIIRSNRTITPAGTKKAEVLIKDGKIQGIVTDLNEPASMNVTDVGDLVLMPGVIDPHVHINEPGRTDWEGFDTATRAALQGGVTTLVDMPLNSSPVTTTVDALDQKLAAAKKNLHVDCGFWGGIIPGNEKEIVKLAAKGVLGFKAFLVHSGIDEFPNVTEVDLRKAMPVIAKQGLPLLVHCEISGNDKMKQVKDKRSYKEYLSSRPKKWEDDAIALMIRLCGEYNCKTHIVHLSSADSIEQIALAKQKGMPLTVETGQHYLYFNAEGIADGKTAFKCAPPIREKENCERLWKALKEGIIDFIATDHSPAPPALKEIDTGDLTKAWGGIASLQFSLPALWTAAKKHGCTLENMAKWLCTNPSFLSRSLNTKGQLAIGYEADLVVWDPDETFNVTEQIIQHRHKITPYVGETFAGVVHQTYLNGVKLFDKGKVLHLNKGRMVLNQSHE